MVEGEDEKTGKEQKKRKAIDDWMVRVSFAEAGEADLGFKETGLDIIRKTKLALEKIMVVRSEKTPEEPEAEKEPAAGEKLRVMVLDDEPIVGKRLKPTLTKSGFEVEVFLDPREALARLEEKEFDIVVTDLRMEEVDGIHILEHIMEHCQAHPGHSDHGIRHRGGRQGGAGERCLRLHRQAFQAQGADGGGQQGCPVSGTQAGGGVVECEIATPIAAPGCC